MKGMAAAALGYLGALRYRVREQLKQLLEVPRIDDSSRIEAGHFDPAKFKDEYELPLRKLVKRKAAGKTIETPEDKDEGSNVIDLIEALRRSMKGKGKRETRRSGHATGKANKPRARSRGKRKAA